MDQTISATHGEIVLPVILTALGIHCLLQVLKNIFPLGQKEINAWSELLRNKWQIIEIIKKQIRADSKKPISFLFNNHLILISFCVGYDMSTFIRRYGRYLNEKAFAYRQMAFDFTRVKKGYGKHGVHAVAHSNTCLAISIFFYMLLLSVWLKPVALLLCKILFSVVLPQRWWSDENHDHWEAAERHACSADTDWHTPGVWCASLLWFAHFFALFLLLYLFGWTEPQTALLISVLSPLRFIPRSWTMGSSMLHFCFSSRTWWNCLHPTMMGSSTY